MNKLTTNQFIEKAKKIHGDRYDYTNSNYIGSKIDLTITCSIHGDFIMNPSSHYTGGGCRECSKEKLSIERRFSISALLERFKSIHGNRYEYSKVRNYVNVNSKIQIICHEHGEFSQRASKHLVGNGCQKCAIVKIAQSVFSKSKQSKQNFSHIIPPQGARIIPLTQGKYALVDEEDYERVNQYNWSCSKSGYVSNTQNGFVHRFIMGLEKGNSSNVDHKDGNPLNNRKSNLRICTQAENSKNKRGTKSSTSKYKGVHWNKRSKSWVSCVGFNYKNIHLGYFISEEDAARAYDAKAKELHKEFAKLNFTKDESKKD